MNRNEFKAWTAEALLQRRAELTEHIRDYRAKRCSRYRVGSTTERRLINLELQRRRTARNRRVASAMSQIEVVAVDAVWSEVHQNGSRIYRGPTWQAKQFASQARKRLLSLDPL